MRIPVANRGLDDAACRRVSVCMASYNGGKYIATQLESILKQLNAEDEVIVVDDASADKTCDIVRKFADPRIVLFIHEANQGVVKTFEEAISRASGDILFLSDQDDIWAENKVPKVLSIFEQRPDVNVVCSGTHTIDEHGISFHNDIYSKPKPFTAALLSNLLFNRFQGSAMAFRSRLIPRILPFPSNYYVPHDIWIGLRNRLTGGKTFYIDEPLLFYRRHSMNASHTVNRYLQIKKRVHLLCALFSRFLKDVVK